MKRQTFAFIMFGAAFLALAWQRYIHGKWIDYSDIHTWEVVAGGLVGIGLGTLIGNESFD